MTLPEALLARIVAMLIDVELIFDLFGIDFRNLFRFTDGFAIVSGTLFKQILANEIKQDQPKERHKHASATCRNE